MDGLSDAAWWRTMTERWRIAAVLIGAVTLSSSTTALALPNPLRVEAELGEETGLYAVPSYHFLGMGAAATVVPGLDVAAGARVGWGASLPTAALAGYARSTLFAVAGSYRPAVGLELEATSALSREPGADDPPGSMARRYAETNHENVLRLALIMSPARWEWGPTSVAVASLRLGTPLSRQCGERVYLAVFFVTLGYSP